MNEITVTGAREHNLKNVDLSIPRNKITALVGVSGSGKSTIAFDIIYSEGQRQYLESLSTYAARLLSRTDRPDVDEIKGLSPTVLIEQKPLLGNPRSTVGTVTEIYTYLRLLFSRLGNNDDLSAGHFSFNTPLGACPKCKGLGFEVTIDPYSFIDFSKSLNEGAVNETTFLPGGRYFNILRTMDRLDFDKPLEKYSPDEIDFLLYSPQIKLQNSKQGFIQSYSWTGIIRWIIGRTKDLRGISKRTISRKGKTWISVPCSECNGSRLNKKARESLIGDCSIVDFVHLPLTRLVHEIATITQPLAAPIVSRIKQESQALIDVGVGYLHINRSVDTLSAGEAQRLKLARELGSDLIEMTYLLDEPTVGLHARDTERLVEIIRKIRDAQNTVILVEHDEEVIKAADNVIEVGPKAGRHGGEVVATGSPIDIMKDTNSLTGRYLSGTADRFKKNGTRTPSGYIEINNVSLHNLKNLSVRVPTGIFVAVTGVSGSGKSTLIQDVMVSQFPDKIISVDQSPIGAMARGMIATYCGVWDNIRKQLAHTWNIEPSLLSFNSKGGCPDCKGLGYQTVNMHFLADMKVKCENCQGKKYVPSVLELRHNGKNMADILQMTALEATEFFDDPDIRKGLQILVDVGLDYLELGQTLDTLSGGEGQRLKLAKYLQRSGQIYTLDEPTTGLHPYDVDKVLHLLHKLVDRGNTVITIEHNTHVISTADWVIDLGPEGGDEGGKVVFEGTPEGLMECEQSYTGKYLRVFLKGV